MELVQGDVTDPVSLREACAGTKQVVHLVAIIRERGPGTFQAVNVRGTQNVVEGAGEAGIEHFIHMSALGAAPEPRYRYTYSKWLGEEAVRQSGLPYTIFRPSVIFGEGFGFVDRLVQAVRMTPGLAPFPDTEKSGSSRSGWGTWRAAWARSGRRERPTTAKRTRLAVPST